MATMEYYGAAQMGPQGRNGKTNNYEQSNINNSNHSSLFHNNNHNSTIHENTTNPPSEDAYRQIIPSAPSGDGDMLQIPSASVDSTGNYTDDGILKCSDDDVDSALLAALRDPRERVSLLRTEQVLIDFMNQPDGYMEIGGPYNSIVLSPTGSITAKATNSNKLLNNDFFGGRTMQTSFQRCWLHRLADRFNITRETGCLREDSIRLVKIRESRIPRKLLSQLDPSEYAQATQPMDDSSSSMGGLTQQFSSTSFLAGNNNIGSPSQLAPAGVATSAPPKAKQPKKMKIMKRNSSSSFGSTGSLNKGSNGGKSTTAAATASRKSKNFSDKEKAYAEARARIFNENNASANPGNEAGKPAATGATTSDVAIVSTCNPPVATSSSTATSPITSKTPSAASSNAPSPSSSPSPAAVIAGLEQAVEIDDTTAVPTLTTTSLPAVTRQSQFQQQLQPQQAKGPRRAAAASAGGGTKATYRNRRQEESDPDFQRGFHSVPMMPAYDTGYMYGYQAQQQYYVYPDDAAAATGATYYAAASASSTATTSGAPSLTNNSKGPAPYASYSQATAYVSNDGNIQAATTSNAIGASTAVGADGRRGRGSLNAAAPSAASRGYYNPYAYSTASSVATSSRQGDGATTTNSASQAVPPYEEFPALR